MQCITNSWQVSAQTAKKKYDDSLQITECHGLDNGCKLTAVNVSQDEKLNGI